VRVAFLTTVLPSARRTGGEVVSESVVRALRAGAHEVVVIGYARPKTSPAAGEICIGRRPIETSSAGWRACSWMTRALLAGAPYSSMKYRSRGYGAWLSRSLEDPPDAVIIDHAQVHFAADANASRRAPLVFLAHNAEGPMYRGLAQAAARTLYRRLYAREAALMERIECRLAGRARQVWALTTEDAAYFASLSPGADVRVIEAAPAVGLAPAAEPPEYDVALLGTWTWKANRAGLDWFVAHVLPLLDEGLTVAVAGAGSEELGRDDPRLAGMGVVPDAGHFLARARVIAIPSVEGGGTQVKTLDAIATGAGVVATPLAVRGLDDLPSTVAIAERGDRFAAELERLTRVTDRRPGREEAAAWARARSARLNQVVGEMVGELERGRTPAPNRA
jgi:hypothetical protein